MGADLIFIFLLALIIFGPKKLPYVAREIGKFVAEFKRASNDFKSQLQAEIDRAGNDTGMRRAPTILPPESGGTQSSSPAPSIQSPALPAAATLTATPAEASSHPASENPAAAAPAASVLDTDRERLMRTARLAFDAKGDSQPTPLVPDTSSEPPPAPPAHSRAAAQAAEQAAGNRSVANASASVSATAGSGEASASEATEAALPAPPES
jgi:TatA/E family protein of Tat protein translocase